MILTTSITTSIAAPAAVPPLRRWLSRLFGRRQTVRTPVEGVMAAIGGQRLSVSSVNAAGFCTLGYRGPLHPQDRFGFVLTLDGVDIVGDAVVAWRQDGVMGLAFYSLSPAEQGRLAGWLATRGD